MNSNLPTIPCRSALLRSIVAVFIASIIVFGGNLFAAGPTLVSGGVSGTWGPANNPYVVVDHIMVPGDKTLTILPGTEIIIGQGLNLTVDGNILARGTAAKRILFTGPANSLWGGIRIGWSQRTSVFDNCTIKRASAGVLCDIDGRYAGNSTFSIALSACRFEECQVFAVSGRAKGFATTPITGHERYSPRLSIQLRGCTSVRCGKAILLVTEGYEHRNGSATAYVSVQVRNSLFDSCDTAIVTEENSLSGSSDGQIHNNVFANCQMAVDLKPTFDLSVRNNILADCKVGVKRTGTTSGQVGFNCFYNVQTKFVGYPDSYGKVAMNNANGTPCDIAFNIFENPKFAETVSFLLAPDSPCVDAGDPAAAFNDVRFPPSRGRAVNDIGAYGGPNVLADDAEMDGLLDAWEIQYFGNLETTDGASDPDQDGLINTKEALYGTNPTKADTDGDGFNDLAEVRAGTSPTDPNSLPNFALGIEVVAYDLELATAAGRRYQLQASDGLGLWDNLFDPILGDGNVVRKRVEVGDTDYRFFKVKDITNP